MSGAVTSVALDVIVTVKVTEAITLSVFLYTLNTTVPVVVKNPSYGRQSISRPMRIVAPIPQ